MENKTGKPENPPSTEDTAEDQAVIAAALKFGLENHPAVKPVIEEAGKNIERKINK